MTEDAIERCEPLPPARPEGRRFVGHRKVRLGDVSREGRLRLDALTRYTQDVSDDDTVDAGLATEPAWVVRSTVVDEVVPAALGEELAFTTFCSGLGTRWAERRLSIVGGGGARYEVATLWVCVDPESGRPVRLTSQFMELYGPAAGDRRVSARLQVPKPPTAEARGMERERWTLRATDFDVYDHVNNAAYWAVVEEWPATIPPWPRRARIEYREPLTEAEVIVVRSRRADRTTLWWLQGEIVAAAAAVEPLPAGFYWRA